MRWKMLVWLVLLAGSVGAGTLKLQDEDGIVADRAELERVVSEAPFDVLVVASTKAPNKAEFDHYLDGLVQGAQSVVIGFDIAKRHTHAITGPWIRISSGAVSAACSTANPYFRERRYGAGVARIVTEIRAGITPVSTLPSVGTVAPSGLSWGWVLLGTLGFGLVASGAWALVTSGRRKKRVHGERDEQRRHDTMMQEAELRELRQQEVQRQPVGSSTQAARSPRPGKAAEYANSYGARVIVTPAPPQAPVVVRDSSLTDYLVLDHVLNHGHRDAPMVAPQPPYRAPEPDPAPSSSSSYSSGSSDWGAGSGSSGGSDFSGGGGDSGGSSGGSDW